MRKQKQVNNAKTVRRKHAPEYKQEALALATRIGVAKAALQLGQAESQLYGWRTKGQAQLSQSEREQQQATEIARLKRQLVEKTEEVAILNPFECFPEVADTGGAIVGGTIGTGVSVSVHFATFYFFSPPPGIMRSTEATQAGESHEKTGPPTPHSSRMACHYCRRPW